jgi:hypothetical protein
MGWYIDDFGAWLETDNEGKILSPQRRQESGEAVNECTWDLLHDWDGPDEAAVRRCKRCMAAHPSYMAKLSEAQADVVWLTKERDALRAALETLRSFASDMAEGDCEYGDNCPTFGTRHGSCDPCRARAALDAVKKGGG